MRKQSKLDLWKTVDPRDDQSMRVLAVHLRCTVGELRMAVQRVGPTVADVRNYVMRSRGMNEGWEAARVRDSHRG